MQVSPCSDPREVAIRTLVVGVWSDVHARDGMVCAVVTTCLAMLPLVDALVAVIASVERVSVPIRAVGVFVLTELARVAACTVIRILSPEAYIAQVYFVETCDCAWGRV